jgi:lipopolysaccharide biosynthesis glycosyltransferase
MTIHPIHIAFSINDAYAHYVCVTMKSIVNNHPDDTVTIHILSDYISEKSKRLISESIRDSESHISIAYHVMDNCKFEGLKVRHHWTLCVWYRLALCDVLPADIHRVLYLDADTVVVENLSHLFQMDMENKSIAAVIDDYASSGRATRLGYEESKGYVCAGIMLMNLDYWRQHNLSDKSLNWARTHSDILRFLDQDVINVLCQDSKIILPLNYAVASHFFQSEVLYREHLTEIKECIEHPIIIHYICKPWLKETAKVHPLYKIWRYYNGTLQHPVRLSYESKGVLRLKVQVWKTIHPFSRRYQTISGIKNMIALYEHGIV